MRAYVNKRHSERKKCLSPEKPGKKMIFIFIFIFLSLGFTNHDFTVSGEKAVCCSDAPGRPDRWENTYSNVDSRSNTTTLRAIPTLWASLSGTFLQTLSARFGYRHWRAFFISAQLSTDAVSALLRKVWVLIRLWKQPSAPSTHVNMQHMHPG